MGRAVETEPRLSAEQAVLALARLSAYSHARYPSRVSARLGTLMDAHQAARVPAVTALDEALTLLQALGARDAAVAWCDRNSGAAGFWPTRESLELRERVRVTGSEPS